jgi:hypothetical protein
VLAAGVYKQQHGRLRVLDVMSGSGMRGARYLTQVRKLCWQQQRFGIKVLVGLVTITLAAEVNSSSCH